MLNNHKLKKEDDELCKSYASVCVCACVHMCSWEFDCVLQIKECIIVTVVAKGCVGVDTRYCCMAADVA